MSLSRFRPFDFVISESQRQRHERRQVQNLVRSADRMMVTLRVRAATATQLDELNTFAVIMAEETDGSGRRIELQRAIEFDAQDHSLGMDTYCTYLDDGACEYGGIRKCVLNRHELLLAFSAETAATLGLDEQRVVQLEVDAKSLDEVRAGILRIFEGDREPPILVGFEP